MPASSEALQPPPTAFRADPNGDGQVDLGDAAVWLERLYFLPGDWILWAVAKYAPPIAALLGSDAPAYGGFLSGTIALAFWLVAWVAVGVALEYLVAWDRRATRGLAGLFGSGLRSLRVARALWRGRSARAKTERAPVDLDLVSDVELAAVEVGILRELADLGPGFAASVTDVAHALRLRVDQVRDPLDGLQRKGLVVRTLGGADGDSAYALNASGRAALLLHLLAPRE